MAGKIQRAQTDILLDLSGVDAGETHFVDIAECLSILNRRMYEQGRLYHLSAVTSFLTRPDSAAGNSSFTQFQLMGSPNTWVTANAWYKAKKTWDEMRREVLKNNPSLRSKWDDFKVHLNQAHFTAGQAANITPFAAKEGEWNMATMTLPDWSVADTAKEFEVGLMQDDIGSVAGGDLTYGGIITNYAESRALVRTLSPSTPDAADSWGIRLLDLGGQESELTDQIIAENDSPPYDVDDYPGTGTNQEYGTPIVLSNNAYNLETKVAGTYLPCGLLGLTLSGASDDGMVPGMILHVSPGSYKGVHAPTMRQ